MASVWRPVRNGSVMLALVAAVMTASCTPHPAEDGTGADDGLPFRSAFGDFLAGRLAQTSGDIRAAAEYYTAALDHDPDNQELMQRAFTLMVAEGRLDAAMPLADRLVALDSDSPVPQMVLGVRAAQAGHFDEAERHFAALPKRGVNAFLGPLLTAWSQAGQSRTDESLATLAVLTRTAPLKALHGFHSGLINDLADRAPAAGAGYEIALAAAQINIRAVEAAGSFYQRNGNPDRARALYQRYQGEHPETMLFDGGQLLQAGPTVARAVPDARAGLAEAMFDVAVLMRQSNATDFAMLFSRLTVALQPDFPLAQMTIADILSSQGRGTEANALYHAIAATSPVHAFGRLRVAVNLDDMGDEAGAIAELDRLAAEHPDNVEALVTKGDLHRKHKDYAEAAQAYGAAIARVSGDQPGYWALYYSRGVAYERSNQWAKAEIDLKTALRLQPDQPEALNYLGYSWVDKGLHLAEGRAMIEKAVELRPNDGAIVDSLGWALYRTNDFPNAVRLLERAIELKGEDPTINEHLGDAYWQVGRSTEAQYQWQRSMGLDPEPDQISALKEKIRTGALPARPAP
jgi:tetratricopeptide (TPR) repeat protein